MTAPYLGIQAMSMSMSMMVRPDFMPQLQPQLPSLIQCPIMFDLGQTGAAVAHGNGDGTALFGGMPGHTWAYSNRM